VAFERAATLETSKFYMGNIMSFLVRGDESDGKVAMMEYRSKPGNEPPPHIHLWEHEIYYILEGNLEAYVDGEVLKAFPGQSVFLPRGKAHTFTICSPHLRMLILVLAAGGDSVGLDTYFSKMAGPADSMMLPNDAVTYLMDDPAHAVRLGAEHGLHILTPEETAKALPHYPGFGV
jgi:quercetin dioxygenase-like cupin family protein